MQHLSTLRELSVYVVLITVHLISVCEQNALSRQILEID